MSARESAQWRVPVDAADVTAIFEPATAGSGDTVLVCAHGAGGHMHDRGMIAVAQAIRDAGVGTVRFNFLYRERKSGRPDPMPVLTETVKAVAERARLELGPRRLFMGGRSMGGRAASMLAAEGYPCDGLILLAYPLHPAGQPEKLRVAHLASIPCPVLCLNGTSDALCQRDLMEQAIAPLESRWTMHWLDGADHSFHVLKSSGRTDAVVMGEVTAAVAAWQGTTPPNVPS